MPSQRRNQVIMLLAVVKLLVLLIVIIGLPLLIYFAYPEWIDNFTSRDKINRFLIQHETNSVLIYIGLQLLQVTVAFIPGQALQFAGGYAFGVLPCYFYSILGIAGGTVISFTLARILGRDAMHVIFGEKRISHYVEVLNSKKAILVLIVLYVIPGVPKDLISYAAGVSELKLLPLLTLSLIGRTPAMIGMTAIGWMFQTGSQIGLIILSVLAVLMFSVSLIFRHQLMHFVDGFYDKIQVKNSKKY